MNRQPDLHIALHAATPQADVALCAALGLPEAAGAPDWVHLLPAGEIRTGDNRGPYRVADAQRLVTASLQAGERLPIDESHATDLAAPRGEPAPARGWIVELQSRNDGIWGRVEWTEDGRKLVEGRAYRGLSPVINHTGDKTVTAILRASLVNRPNLRGLTALHHQETTMEFLTKLIAALGLPAATTEEAALAAVTALHAEQKTAATALQAQLDAAIGPIATLVGLQAGADAKAVLAGVTALKTGGGDAAVMTALQGEITALANHVNTLLAGGKKEKAETAIDAAIAARRVGIKPLRDRYIAMHMADPAGTEAMINAMPILGDGGQIRQAPTPAANGEIALQAEQLAAANALGIDAKAYAATVKAERETAL